MKQKLSSAKGRSASGGKKIAYWLGVVVVGIALGLGLQFVRAWTEPTVDPPGGNVGAPINTGDAPQAKGAGNLPRTEKLGSIVANDFCLPGEGGNEGICLSHVTGAAVPTDMKYQCPDMSCNGYGQCGMCWNHPKACWGQLWDYPRCEWWEWDYHLGGCNYKGELTCEVVFFYD